MKREYYIKYQKNNEEIHDIFNTLETMIFVAISKFNRRIHALEIVENHFLENN